MVGYWRSSNDSEAFVKCPNPSACLGGNLTNLVGSCAEGYKGIACGNCDLGYKYLGNFKCSKCPPYSINIV